MRWVFIKNIIFVIISICLFNISLIAQWQVNKDNINAKINESGSTYLKDASFNGYLKPVKYLLESSTLINANNETALSVAKENKHTEVTEYLVKKNTDGGIH